MRRLEKNLNEVWKFWLLMSLSGAVIAYPSKSLFCKWEMRKSINSLWVNRRCTCCVKELTGRQTATDFRSSFSKFQTEVNCCRFKEIQTSLPFSSRFFG